MQWVKVVISVLSTKIDRYVFVVLVLDEKNLPFDLLDKPSSQAKPLHVSFL